MQYTFLTALVLCSTLALGLEAGHQNSHSGSKNEKYAEENAVLYARNLHHLLDHGRTPFFGPRSVPESDTEEPQLETRSFHRFHEHGRTPFYGPRSVPVKDEESQLEARNTHHVHDHGRTSFYGPRSVPAEDEQPDLEARNLHHLHAPHRTSFYGPRSVPVDNEDTPEPQILSRKVHHLAYGRFRPPHHRKRSVEAETEDDDYEQLAARDVWYDYYDEQLDSPFLHDRLEAEKANQKRSIDMDDNAIDYAHPAHNSDFDASTPILPRSVEDNWHGARRSMHKRGPNHRYGIPDPEVEDWPIHRPRADEPATGEASDPVVVDVDSEAEAQPGQNPVSTSATITTPTHTAPTDPPTAEPSVAPAVTDASAVGAFAKILRRWAGVLAP